VSQSRIIGRGGDALGSDALEPVVGLYSLQREMDLLMRRLNGDWPAFAASGSEAWVPAVDVFHRDEDLVIRAELPGIDPEKDVEITLQEGVLTIRGERRHEARSSQNGVERIESATGSFSRSVALPEGVTEKDVRAHYENGIMEVVVPGAARLSGVRRIPIEVGGRRKALTTRGRKS
jgi:HSP20 family protein